MSTKKLRPKTCKAKGCDNKFTPWNSTQVACSHPCALDIVKEKKARAWQKETIDMRRRHLANDRSHQLKLAQKAFNDYIRERDKHQPCISCGTRDPDLRYDAGHYRTIGAHPELRFEEDNCHKQCHYNCNINRSGNIVDYRIGLVGRIGAGRVEWLEQDHPPKNWTIEEIVEIRETYKAKRKELIKQREIYIITS